MTNLQISSRDHLMPLKEASSTQPTFHVPRTEQPTRRIHSLPRLDGGHRHG